MTYLAALEYPSERSAAIGDDGWRTILRTLGESGFREMSIGPPPNARVSRPPTALINPVTGREYVGGWSN